LKGNIWTSKDGGASWTPDESIDYDAGWNENGIHALNPYSPGSSSSRPAGSKEGLWTSVASSGNGSTLVAVSSHKGSPIWISTNGLLCPKWALRIFEDFHRNFTGILEDGELNFKKAACISDSYSVELVVLSVKIPLKISAVLSTPTPNTGLDENPTWVPAVTNNETDADGQPIVLLNTTEDNPAWLAPKWALRNFRRI
jgi:hypothetical protein